MPFSKKKISAEVLSSISFRLTVIENKFPFYPNGPQLGRKSTEHIADEIKIHLSVIHGRERRERGCIAKERTEERRKNHTRRNKVFIHLGERGEVKDAADETWLMMNRNQRTA